MNRRTFLASLAAVVAAPLVPTPEQPKFWFDRSAFSTLDVTPLPVWEGIPENPLFDTADVTAIYLRQSMATILDNRDRVLFEAVQRG